MVFAVLTAVPISAQAVSPEAGASALEEVIVTAQKREQNPQSVPVAVTVLTAAMIEQRGIQAFTDLPRAVPALTIKTGRNLQTSSISVRGIGTFSTSVGIEPSVSVVVDDVAGGQQAQAGG